ncbi:VCBS repeat-containing protein [Winogradskyella sp.]|uniref:FG-GAP repeat domain-containing protein n=1 Tax=Winogradskyella sp. TaxID=1883156 RepID=UPI0025E98DF6|nr:VCBS repeat-containing protein [Winogradskyella sp.]
MSKKLRLNRKCFPLLFMILTALTYAQTFERVEAIVGITSQNSNGISVADYDNDNDLDIFVVAKAIDNEENSNSLSRLYRNNNDGSFTDVTELAGFSDLYAPEEIPEAFEGLDGYKYGAYWGDYNNDGFPDLFLTYLDSVQLWRNLGNGTFTDVTVFAGLNA